MKYKCKFPNSNIEKKFEASLRGVHNKELRERIMVAIESLEKNPRPYGEKRFKKLKPPASVYSFAAGYRLRIGDYRVLYDIDDQKKVVWVYALRRRSERTYR